MKYLGKITNAKFGKIHDMQFLMGLQLVFSIEHGGTVGCNYHCINMSESCDWPSDEYKYQVMEKEWTFIHNLLCEAKVSNVSELIGIPVEVEIENNMFKDFKILTEVL